eukprot:493951-Pelagomonas_calceolata.AAC.1
MSVGSSPRFVLGHEPGQVWGMSLLRESALPAQEGAWEGARSAGQLKKKPAPARAPNFREIPFSFLEIEIENQNFLQICDSEKDILHPHRHTNLGNFLG